VGAFLASPKLADYPEDFDVASIPGQDATNGHDVVELQGLAGIDGNPKLEGRGVVDADDQTDHGVGGMGWLVR
jgi:hypothetical protein